MLAEGGPLGQRPRVAASASDPGFLIDFDATRLQTRGLVPSGIPPTVPVLARLAALGVYISKGTIYYQ